MIGLLVIFFAMASQDVLQAVYTRSLVERRWWKAGSADGFMDVVSFGLVGVSIYNHPNRTWLWLTMALSVLFAASVVGTRIGALFDDWLNDHFPLKGHP